MTTIRLKSKKRTETGKKVARFREQGMIPAVMYGHKVASQNLWIDYVEFKKAFEKGGESTLIELEIEGGGKSNVLVHDMQNDAVSGKVAHVDLFQIKMDEKIDTQVPLEFVGESAAVREMGGILVKNMDELSISCFPGDLPSHIEADISLIKTFDDHLKVGDLKIPAKVEVEADPETVVAIVKPPRTEDEMSKLNEKVEEDVTKVEGVIKAEPAEKKEGEEK